MVRGWRVPSSLILRWSIRIRTTPCGESDSSRSRSCSTSNVGPSGSCSRCLMSLISSDLADPPDWFSAQRRIVLLTTATHRFFPPNTYFARKPSSRRFFASEKIRRSSEFFALFAKLLINRRHVSLSAFTNPNYATCRTRSPRQRFSITCNSWRNFTLLPCGRTPRKFTLG